MKEYFSGFLPFIYVSVKKQNFQNPFEKSIGGRRMIEVTTYALSRIQVTYIYGAKSCHPNNRWGGEG